MLCAYNTQMQFGKRLLLLLTLVCVVQSKSVSLNTKLGKISGVSNKIGDVSVQKFFGIPYADPPVGHRRFKKPVPLRAMLPNGNFDATKLASVCPQEHAGHLIGNEDCLTLNIYIPISSKTGGLKPVLIWIHGGAFIFGSANEYPADFLAAFGDVVVVTVNYRLGLLGFLTTGKSDLSGNYGLFDQKLALEWVKDNIEDYHGDPNQITIFGESAGGRSVSFQAFSPLNDASVFQKIIIQSGSALSLTHLNRDPMPVAVPVISATGCSIGSNDLISCLQEKSIEELFKAAALVERRFAWFPIVDGDFLPFDLGYLYGNFSLNGVTEDIRLNCGNLAQYDMLGGWNDQDGLGYIDTILRKFAKDVSSGITQEEMKNALQYYPFYQRPEGDKTNPLSDVYQIFYQVNPQPGITFNRSVPLQRMEWFYNLAGDVSLKLPVLMNVKLHSALSSKSSYAYEFTHKCSWKSRYKVPDWMRVGANHMDEIPYVFGWPLLRKELETNKYMQMPELAMNLAMEGLHVEYTAEEEQLSAEMMTSWINFAKTGSPNTDFSNRQWMDYSTEQGQKVALISINETVMVEYYMKERLQLFEAISAAVSLSGHKKS